MKLKITKILKETIWSFLSKGVTMILFLIINIVIARKLEVEQFGLWSLFLSAITIIYTLSYFGVNASANKFIAQHNKTDNLKGVILSSLKLRFLFSIIFSCLLLLFHKQLALLLRNQELEILFLLGAPMVFLSGFVEYFKSVFIGLHRIKFNFILNFVEYTLNLLLIIIFLYFSNSIISLVSSYIISLSIIVVIGFLLLYFNFYKSLKSSDKNYTKELLHYSYPLIFISLGFIVLTEVDTIMIGIFSNTAEVGVYAIAKQIILKLPHIAIAITMGTMPIFGKMNNENKSEFKSKLFSILKITFIIYLFIILILLFVSPIFIPLLFGEDYIASVLPLQILTVYLFSVSISLVLGSFLDYAGKAKKRALNISVTIVLNIFLNLILIPRYGAVGAAIATSISYLPYVFLNWLEVKKTFTSGEGF